MKPWQKLANFFETGDLVPFAVIISVYHYYKALEPAGEGWVAIPVALSVDLLHFRTIRRSVAFPSRVSTLIAAATTLMALGYHVLFYQLTETLQVWQILLYALPIPTGIAILAWHSATDPLEAVRIRWRKRVRTAIRIGRQLQVALRETESTLAQTQADMAQWQAIAETAQQAQAQQVSEALTEAQHQAQQWQTQAEVAQQEADRLRVDLQQAKSELAQRQANSLDEAELTAMRLAYQAWTHINPRMQVAAQVNAGLLEVAEAAEQIGMSTGTVRRDAARLNGNGG